MVRGSLSHLQNHFKEFALFFAKDRQSTLSPLPQNYRHGSMTAILVEILFPNWQSRYACNNPQDSKIASPTASSLNSINASRK